MKQIKKRLALVTTLATLSAVVLLTACVNNQPTNSDNNTTDNTTQTCTQHVENVLKGKLPTCTETGWTEGKSCSVCGEILVKQETIPARGHTEAVHEGFAATCTTDGMTDGKHCSVCNEVTTERKKIPALGHTEVVDAGFAATCTTDGMTDGKHCSVCNEVITAQNEIAALGHTVVTDPAVAATCTTAGKTEGKHCSACNTVMVEQEAVSALGHKWGSWTVTKEATTEEKGEEVRTCTNTGCTETQKRDIPKVTVNEPNGHVWDEGTVTKAPTCTEAGNKHFKCTNETCTAFKDETISALGHTEVTDEAVAPTCTEKGHTAGSHCSVCNEVLKATTEIAPNGHDYGDWTVTKEPTYKEDGEKTRTCSECNDVDTETIEKLRKFTKEQEGTYTCICQGKKETYHLTLVINADGTVELVDGSGMWSAENVEVVPGEINDGEGDRPGYTFVYSEKQVGTSEAKFYFENGTIQIDINGTFIPMVKKTESVSFTASQQGTYTGTYYGFTRSLTIAADGTVTFVYGYRADRSEKEMKQTVKIDSVSKTGDIYAFIYSDYGDSDFPRVVLFEFTEDGKLQVTEYGETYELSRA